MPSETLAIAQWLVHERGFSVIPLDHPADTTQTDPARIGKVAVEAWKPFQTARPTDGTLRSWFDTGRRRNIGIPTGALSGIIALDCDSRAAIEWADTHLPSTEMRTRTARGEHRIYRRDPNGARVRNKVRLRTGDPAVKIDVRGDGGYIVAPGSTHASGTRYERIGTWPPVAQLAVFDPAWIDEEPRAEPPADAAPSRQVRRARTRADRKDHDRVLTRAPAYLRATPPAVQGEGGDTHTFGVVCRMVRGFDLAESDAREVLSEWNQRCQPPWSERELDEKIDGALKYGTEAIGARKDQQRDEVATTSRLTCAVDDNHGDVDSGQQTPAQRTITLTAASAIRVRPVRWLEDARLALGTMALLGGREGVGKTLYASTLAATITRGTLPGTYHGTPRAVVIVATEDSWEHTIVPRLMAAGADLDLVYRVDVVTAEGADSTLSLPCDLEGLGRVVREAQAALILLDPLLSRLDPNLDTHKDADVRLALEPLVTLAEAADVCVLGIIHVNKGTSTDPLTMLMGSRAFAAVSRSVLFVLTDPEDETVRLLGQPKNNLGRVDLPMRSFRIVGEKVADTDEGPVWTGKLDWLPETDRSIAEAVDAAATSTGDRTATSEAADWLQDYLTDQGDACESAAIKDAGKKAGHSQDALKRARQRLRITCKAFGFPRHTYWKLPVPQSEHARAGGGPPTALTAPTDTQSVQSVQLEQSGDTPRARPPLDPAHVGTRHE